MGELEAPGVSSAGAVKSRCANSYSQPHRIRIFRPRMWRGNCPACRRSTLNTDLTQSPSVPRCLDTRAVLDALSISRATLYRLIGRGDFPAPLKVTGTKNVWLMADIDGFLAQRVATRATPRLTH